MKLQQKDIDRFHQSYVVNDETGCWEWTLSLNHNGYGRFKVSGFVARAHRYSFLLHHGHIPIGMIVCHECDNPKCVRPEHLWLGTNRDNQHDMIAKGRKRVSDQRGENNSRAVLNREKAEKIIIRITEGASNKEVAREYGVSHSTVSLIRLGKIWADVPRPDQHAARFERYASLR